MDNISVIIPAHNEQETIGEIIDLIQLDKRNIELIVVNNASTDNTEKIAIEKGAKVINCEKLGKGNAMKAGLNFAQNEIIVFLDSDIVNYHEQIIDILVEPLINEKADFCKAEFNRTEGGVVTEVAVKPLLELIFPNMQQFSEPLSGMISGKKSIFEKLEFETDYGVDIGILIDVIEMGANVKEVNIGEIKNMSHVFKNNKTMKEMSKQIMKAILKRA